MFFFFVCKKNTTRLQHKYKVSSFYLYVPISCEVISTRASTPFLLPFMRLLIFFPASAEMTITGTGHPSSPTGKNFPSTSYVFLLLINRRQAAGLASSTAIRNWRSLLWVSWYSRMCSLGKSSCSVRAIQSIGCAKSVTWDHW